MCREDIYYTEGTLYKVYEALRASGATEEQAQSAINGMQNAGILFRERVPQGAPRPPVMRREETHTQPHPYLRPSRAGGNVFENLGEELTDPKGANS